MTPSLRVNIWQKCAWSQKPHSRLIWVRLRDEQVISSLARWMRCWRIHSWGDSPVVHLKAREKWLRDKAQAEWGRLILEQSTWTAHSRIEVLATEQLKMHIPGAADVKMVAP